MHRWIFGESNRVKISGGGVELTLVVGQHSPNGRRLRSIIQWFPARSRIACTLIAPEIPIPSLTALPSLSKARSSTTS